MMQLVKTVYQDKYGNEWVMQKHYLHKKRGDYIFWTAECANRHEYRGESKKELFAIIKSNVHFKIDPNEGAENIPRPDQETTSAGV